MLSSLIKYSACASGSSLGPKWAVTWMLESPGRPASEAEGWVSGWWFSVHCLFYDDQCLLPALPEVQVKTEQNQAKQMTLEGFRSLSPILSGRGLWLGVLAPLKPSDPLKEPSVALGCSQSINNVVLLCPWAVWWLHLGEFEVWFWTWCWGFQTADYSSVTCQI